jgi:16S rRNA (guanine1207-N2)-methyltransferase
VTAVASTYVPEVSSAADRLLLDEATPLLAALEAGVVAVVDTPEIAARIMGSVAELRISVDSADDTERLLSGAASLSVQDAVRDADVVLLRLPKSLDRLDDIARLVARNAKPTVTVLAGGRLKYMTRSMNEVLGRSFGDVRASLARQKSRVLFASSPLEIDAPQPRRTRLDEFDLEVVAWGGVFAGSSLDIGTRAMLATFYNLPAFETAIDFGSGTGILAALLKRARPSARVIASDDSAIATESARETFVTNGLDVEVRHESSLSGQPDGSADLIVLNPPFHDEGAVSTEAAHEMFEAASRKLKPGGELRTVWNSNLGYRAALTRAVGPTTELARTPKFTVTASTKPLT